MSSINELSKSFNAYGNAADKTNPELPGMSIHQEKLKTKRKDISSKEKAQCFTFRKHYFVDQYNPTCLSPPLLFQVPVSEIWLLKIDTTDKIDGLLKNIFIFSTL